MERGYTAVAQDASNLSFVSGSNTNNQDSSLQALQTNCANVRKTRQPHDIVKVSRSIDSLRRSSGEYEHAQNRAFHNFLFKKQPASFNEDDNRVVKLSCCELDICHHYQYIREQDLQGCLQYACVELKSNVERPHSGAALFRCVCIADRYGNGGYKSPSKTKIKKDMLEVLFDIFAHRRNEKIKEMASCIMENTALQAILKSSTEHERDLELSKSV
ncbi:hypothetical protein Dda_7419 [Drechslerella dactyloides]|uniref:Uncharacterized protein n=1 Tax=Drechslerella dactyloides TaxID=74499 RepID=A0AAD6NGS3_DREDA|nr:hypothetical protein Dda_7419 [Drechslerella dactyloides]